MQKTFKEELANMTLMEIWVADQKAMITPCFGDDVKRLNRFRGALQDEMQRRIDSLRYKFEDWEAQGKPA